MRQTWVRRTLQRHANVDVRFILAQPDLPDGSHLGGLGSSAGAAEAIIEAAYRVLEVEMLLATILPPPLFTFYIPTLRPMNSLLISRADRSSVHSTCTLSDCNLSRLRINSHRR